MTSACGKCGAHAKQLVRFALLLSERGGLAISIFLNSVLIARLMSPDEAAAYFLTASVLQIGMSPWVPAGEVVWLGKAKRLNEGEITNQVVITSWYFTLIFALACGLFLASHVSRDFSAIVVIGILSYILNIFVLCLLPSKFGNIHRFRSYAIGYTTISITAKILVLVVGAPAWMLYLALFVELSSGGLIAILICRSSFMKLRFDRLPNPRQAVTVVAPAFSVMMALVASRSGLLIVSLAEQARDVQTFGLAFQILNAASLVSTAVSGTAANGLRTGSARPLLLPSALVAICWASGLIAFLIAGRPLVSLLLGSDSNEAYGIILAGFPFCAALLVHGLTNAVAAFYNISRTYALCSFGIAVATGTVMLASVGGIVERTFFWASTYAVLSIMTCILITFLGRKRISVLEGRQDEHA